jgi:hypothetical protein
MNNIFNKYIFPLATLVNTGLAVSYIHTLFTPQATPLTAFLAFVVSGVALTGIAVMAFERKIRA